MNKKDIKIPVKPNWRDSEFAKSIEGQVMIQIEKAIENKHFIEAEVLSWSTIEQILIPRLLKFIAGEFKMILPEGIYKLNSQSINYIYYCFSHDKKLYEKLEIGRGLRNQVIHKLFQENNIEKIKKIAKESTKASILIQEAIMERFSGKVLIPSLNLYRNGWNDCRMKTIEKLEKLKHKIN